MKKQFVFKLICAFGLGSTLITSCVNSVDLSNISKDIKFDEKLSLPIGESSITVQNLVDQIVSKDLFSTKGEEIYFQNYDSTEFSFRNIDISKTSQAVVCSIGLPGGTYPGGATLPPIETDNSTNLGLNSNPSTERIDSVKLESADLQVNISVSDVNISASNLKFTLSFPSSKMRNADGSSTSVEFSPSAYNTPIVHTFHNTIFNTSNSASGIPIHIKVEARTGNFPVTFTANSKINVSLKFSNLVWKIAYGYFVPSINATNTIQVPLDMMKSLPNAYMKFANPQASVNIFSNIGTYLRFHVDYVKAFAKATSSQPVYASFKGNQYIDYDISKPKAINDWSEKDIVMDKDNGALDRLFDTNVRPDILEYKFSSQINTDSINKYPLATNYITSDGKIKAKIKMVVPLHLKAGSVFEVTDTIQDLGTSVSKLDSAALIFTMNNGFPSKVTYSMVFLDARGNRIASTLNAKTYTVNAPTVNSDGIVTKVTPQIITIELTKGDLAAIKNAKDMEYKVRFEGQDATQAMHFQTSNSFKVKLSVFAITNTTENY